jgi:acyl-lipid omega-6 desaturase (Delta-12 desaturase)
MSPGYAILDTEHSGVYGAKMTVITKRSVLKGFERPTWRGPAQVVTTAVGLAGGWILTDLAVSVSWLLGVGSSLIIAVFSVRAFIIFHDCAHGSFSHSRRINNAIGSVIGVIVFTPYAHWSINHRRHHAASGDLDRRGSGDVWTMTTDEYLATSTGRRLWYRIYHSPLFLLSIGPLIKFVIAERFILDPGLTSRRVRIQVYLTNVAVAGFAVLMCLWMGPIRYIGVQLMVLAFAGIPAAYLLYVQHSFPGTYWRRHAEWDYEEASLAGSSRLVLPRFLQWVTGNIGFHHIHHLAPRIPNYRLPEAQTACPDVQPGCTLTLGTSLGVLRTKLWDEAAGRYVTFTEAGF